MSVIIYLNGLSYVLDPLMDEQCEETYNRLWKIIQHHPKNEYEYERLVAVSKLWYYQNRCHCHYSINNEHLIQLFDQI